MRTCLPALLTVGLAAGSAFAQGYSTSQATTPEAADLARLGLKADWSTFVPVQTRQDGVALVQPVDEHQIFVQTRGGLLVALDAGSGREQWKFKYPASFTEGFPVGVNEKFVFSVNVSKLFCHQRYTGVLEFETELPEAPSVGPVTDGDQVYVTFTGNKIACYELPPSFHTSEAAKKRAEELKSIGNVTDGVVARSPNRTFPTLPKEPESEDFNVPKSYFDSRFGTDNNQPTYSVAALERLTPPFFLGGLNKVVSLSMLPSLRRPYTLTPEYLTYNQLTPSVVALPPSLARIYEMSNLRPPPFKPKMRWLVETKGKVYAEPIFVPQSSQSAARLWIAEDGRSLQAVIRDREEYDQSQQVWDLPSPAAAGIAGPYQYSRNKSLAFLPLSDGQVLAIDLYGGTRNAPRLDFRTNVGGLLNRLPLGTADGVYVGGDRSGLARINVKTGEVDWRTESDIDHLVAVTADRVIARDRRGNLYLYAKGKADPNTLRARPLGKLSVGGFGVKVTNRVTDRAILASDHGLIVSLRDADAKAAKPALIAPEPPPAPKPMDPMDPADPNGK